MAITRAQQTKQMLQDGGMLVKPRADGKRPGYYGADEGHANDPGHGSNAPGNTGNTGGKNERSTRRERGIMSFGKGPKGTTGNIGGFTDTGPDRTKVSQFSQFGLNTMARNLGPPSLADRFGNITSNVRNFFSRFGPTTTANITDRFGYPTDVQGFGVRSSVGPTGPSRGDERGEIPLWMQLGYSSEAEYNAAMSGGATTPATTEEPPVDLNRIAYRLMADGGAVIDDEPRQAYGLGSIVKKATRAVKKVVKSDLGKAALAAAAIYYGGGGNLFGFQRAGMSGFSFGNLPGAALFKKGAIAKGNLGISGYNMANVAGPKAGMSLGSKLGLAALATSALPLFMGKEEEEEAELSPYVTEGLDIARIRSDPFGAMGQSYRLMAEGGDTEDAKEPVAKKVMPLIDMDGKEKDYRETGGFVDMGRMEKADDVPARLSKNEFVFTADAVRNAGDGSVDKGAEVMYNMMKSLEAGGEVSEESQGLEGARRMFKTSQRLEEVL